MEPPSPSLAAALRELRLVTPRDLRRAARHCRAIARDLPAFDCVWIDALLRLGRLTPFQAERLQTGEAASLRVGGFVLTDRLGGSGEAATFLARPLAGGPPAVLKSIGAADGLPAVRLRLESLVSSGVDSPGVVTPRSVFEQDGRLIVESRYVAGEDARARLVRAGAFPGEAVGEVARQLLAGLGEAHRRGAAHGDVRLSCLRLTPGGEAVLVDFGLRPALSPVLRIDDARPPEAYDGTAPERIGSSAPADAATDVYALGCLLWQLLAGRPPFATGDPLAKLTAHRTRRVPDVRDFAAEVPPELADLIAEMTEVDPARRPADLLEARRRLRGPGRRSLRPWGQGRRVDRSTWAAAATVVLTMTAVGGVLAERNGAVGSLRGAWGAVAGGGAAPAAEKAAGPSLIELPPPDETGVLHLDRPGPYAAAEIAFRGPLVLRGDAENPATVVVSTRPLHVWADSVALEHVRIVYEPPAAAGTAPPALVLAESQTLAVRSSRFEAAAQGRAGAGPTAVAWRPVDRADPTAGRVELTDCVFRGGREAVFADGGRRLAVENVLCVGTGSLVALGAGDGVAIRLTNTTVRGGRSVVACRGAAGPARVEVTAEDSVVDLGADGSLFDPAGDGSGWRWSGAGVVASEGLTLPEERGPIRTVGFVDAVGPRIDGVTRARVEFAGPAGGSDAASVARVSGAPRIAGRTAGVDLSRLPREAAGLGGAR